MLSIHSRREVPWIFGIKDITDHNFSGPISPALLKMVTIRYSVIVMTGATGFPRTIRNFAFQAQGGSIKPLQDDLFVQGNLGGKRDWVKDKER